MTEAYLLDKPLEDILRPLMQGKLRFCKPALSRTISEQEQSYIRNKYLSLKFICESVECAGYPGSKQQSGGFAGAPLPR